MNRSTPGRGAGGDIMQMFEGPGEEALDDAQRARLAQARETFRELEKLTKNIALYGRAHQSVARFRERLFAAITELIGESQQVDFQIGPYDFTMFEQSVYQNPNPERNFVYRFYLDGVRHIILHAGVTRQELDAFVDILLVDWDDPSLFEDDVVTLLWQADFERIQYILIDNFDEDAREGEERLYTVAGVVEQVRSSDPLPSASGPPPLPGRAGPPPPPGAGPPPIPGAGGESMRDRARTVRRSDLSAAGLTEADLARFVETPFAMDEAEFHTLERVIHTHGRETLEKFIEILFKVNLAEDGDGAVDRAGRMVGLFDRIADLLLESGRLGELERLMRKVRLLTGPRGERLPENLRAIHRIFAHWSTPAFADRVLAPLIEQSDHRYAPSILAICALLEPSAIASLARAAGLVRAEEASAALYRLTARLLPGNERPVIDLLREVQPEHAHMLIGLLTRGEQRLRPSIARAAMANPEPKVRFEGLSVLPLVDDAQVLDLMFSALDDPARMVRSKAIHLIARVARPEVHRRVLDCIDKKTFADFDLAEKRRYFAAAALTGDPRERCVALLESGGLIRSRGQDELRHCAVVALAIRLHRDLAPAFQKELDRRLKSELLTEAATWGLQHMQSDRDARTRQLYDIFFKGELTLPEAGAADG